MPLYEIDGIRPELPPEGEYWIAPTAVVIGRVKLERNASIWWGAVVRGDNDLITIGENTNVQDGAVLHTDMGFPMMLARNVTVGHMAMLHGCTVEEGALVGIGSTVLNGARVGRGSIVGANALVAEGKEIAAHSLAVGVPARVVRTFSQEEVAKLGRFADHYVANQRRYRSGLRQIG